MSCMRASIRKVRRPVIPKALRDRWGLRPGEVEERHGRLVIPATGQSISIDDVRSIREAEQR